jgi:hypothetical protein
MVRKYILRVGIGFPVIKLNLNYLLIILWFSFFYTTISKKKLNICIW